MTVRAIALLLVLAAGPAAADDAKPLNIDDMSTEQLVQQAEAYGGFAKHYQTLADDHPASPMAPAYRMIADHFRMVSDALNRKLVGEPPPSFYGEDIPTKTKITEQDVTRSNGDLIRAYLDPVARQSFPKNMQDALAEYVARHPDAVQKYGPPPASPASPVTPQSTSQSAQPTSPQVAGAQSGDGAAPYDSLAGSPSVAAARAELSGAAKGDAASISSDKGLGASGGRVGGKLGAMSAGLGSTSESAAGGTPSGAGAGPAASAGRAGTPAGGSTFSSASAAPAVPHDGENQRAAAEIRSQVAPQRREALLADYARAPSAARFKDLAPVVYRGGAIKSDSDLKTFGFTRLCAPPDDCNAYASYPYSPGQLARAETLNRIPTLAEEKPAGKDETKTVDKKSERSHLAALWAAVGERLSASNAAAASPELEPKRIGGGLSGILARLSGRARDDGRAVGVNGARYAAASAAPAGAGGEDWRPDSFSAGPRSGAGPTGGDIKRGLAPGPAGSQEASRLPALAGALAVAAAAAAGAYFFLFRKRDE